MKCNDSIKFEIGSFLYHDFYFLDVFTDVINLKINLKHHFLSTGTFCRISHFLPTWLSTKFHRKMLLQNYSYFASSAKVQTPPGRRWPHSTCSILVTSAKFSANFGRFWRNLGNRNGFLGDLGRFASSFEQKICFKNYILKNLRHGHFWRI